MTERTRSILKTAVDDFIENGRPITSEYLYDEYNFGIKPAMIRWELSDLCNSGYFYQTHPSGGRFPTNKAYRFFVRDIFNEEEKKIPREENSLIEEFLLGERRPFIEELSEYLNVLSIGCDYLAREVYKSGITELLSNLEVEAKKDIVKIIEDYEELVYKLNKEKPNIKEEEHPKVFIGRNPFIKNSSISVIIDNFTLEDFDFSLIVIGPKRMDYKKSLSVFNFLKKSLIQNNQN